MAEISEVAETREGLYEDVLISLELDGMDLKRRIDSCSRD